MSVLEIRTQINELNEADRVELTEWLNEQQAVIADAEALQTARRRVAELDSGQARAWSEEEFGEQTDAACYGEVEESELALARKRAAELAAGERRLLTDDEFWARLHHFKAGLE